MFKFIKKKNKYQYKTRDLSLLLEPGWYEYQLGNDNTEVPLTFIKKDHSLGALQISIATSQNGEKFSIYNALGKNNKEYIQNIKEYNLRDWIVYEFENIENGMYIKTYYLTKRNVIVYVTYTCELQQKNNNEISDVSKIVKSIELISNN